MFANSKIPHLRLSSLFGQQLVEKAVEARGAAYIPSDTDHLKKVVKFTTEFINIGLKSLAFDSMPRLVKLSDAPKVIWACRVKMVYGAII